ncbi:2424_t:CDS:2 [Diversispora eburnea]|uniref:2424_t:CDS:1 n=1 Tax=Diversispora eburnea TaxID=1213867 RepID=A0A9N9BLW5_9GLOM|nr:2424_t:CDS:2 [Diversispora eburnea]
MSPVDYKASHNKSSKRAQRQTTKHSYYEGESSDIDHTRDPDIIMHDAVLDGCDIQFGIETLKPDEDEFVRGNKIEQTLKSRQNILARLSYLNSEFFRRKDEIFKEKLKQIDEEIKAVREGTHPEFEERLQQIIDKRDQKLERHSLAFISRQNSIQKEYETETSRIEEYYQTQRQAINDRIIAEIEEKKRKLAEDYESYDIHNDTAMEGTLRSHSQRRLRTRTTHEVESEANEDLAEMGLSGYAIRKSTATNSKKK